jgi:predicted RNA-binding Zn-ribbon protein involved in translation (DUF1610 family)
MRFFPSFSATRDRLTRLGPSEPLSRLSLFVIVLLDIFVLFTLFQGLWSISDQVARPEEKFSAFCRAAFRLDSSFEIGDGQTEVERRLRLVESQADGSLYDYARSYSNEPLHVACAEVQEAAAKLTTSNAFHTASDAVSAAEERRTNANTRMDELERSYDSSLLEDIAGQSRENSILPSDAASVRSNMQTQKNIVKQADAEIARQRAAIVALPEWMALWNAVEARSAETRDAYASLVFWYPVVLLLAQFAFLLPVLLVAGAWHTLALRRGSGIAILLSAHLVVVATLPIFIKIVEFALDLLPDRLLTLILDFLREYDLVVVFNYVLILVGIGVTVALVYFIQRKWFGIDRLRAKRLETGACTSCGRSLPREFGIVRHCGFCGASQVISCDACGAETKRHAPHCTHCGAETDESR